MNQMKNILKQQERGCIILIEIYNNDYRNILPKLNKVDCIIADIPYNISFENKSWDKEFVVDLMYVRQKKNLMNISKYETG